MHLRGEESGGFHGVSWCAVHPLTEKSEMVKDERDSDFRLDPKSFPKRLDLELSEEVINYLQSIANASGRSLSEVATDILSKKAGHP